MGSERWSPEIPKGLLTWEMHFHEVCGRQDIPFSVTVFARCKYCCF